MGRTDMLFDAADRLHCENSEYVVVQFPPGQ